MFPSQIEFLHHILDECRYLQKEYANNSFEHFLKDERLSRAICRSLEIIGEASQKIHPDVIQASTVIPWREMSDLRNRIIHNYFGIDYDIVWDIVQTDIPALEPLISQLIENLKR